MNIEFKTRAVMELRILVIKIIMATFQLWVLKFQNLTFIVFFQSGLNT